MHHVDAELSEIVNLLAQVGQIIRKAIGVECHAHPLLGEEPVVIGLPVYVQPLGFRRSIDVALRHYFDQLQHLISEVVAMAVKGGKQRVDREEVGPQPCVEVPQILAANLWLQIIEDGIEKRMGNLFIHGQNRNQQGVNGLRVGEGKTNTMAGVTLH